MTSEFGERLRVEALDAHHERSSFDSGVEPLDRYFRTQASQDARKNMAAPFVLVLPEGTIAGYYTLSSTSVQIAELPEKQFASYPDIHWRLRRFWAVSRWIGGAEEKGTGGFLLADALWRASRSEIASFAVIVDAKDDSARSFYERESFLPFPDRPMKLFRPMADIRKLFQ